MIWLALLLGLALTAFGATAGAAQMSVSKRELARALSRRLRGEGPVLDWLTTVDSRLAAASATTSLGVVLLAAALPAVLGSTVLSTVLAVALMAIPAALAFGYLLPRWLTEPRAERVLGALTPVFVPWSRVMGLLLPTRSGAGARDWNAVWREAAASGGADDTEMTRIGGVMSFTERQVREVMTPRTEIVAVAEDAAVEDIRRVFLESGYSRVPVYRGNLDEIVGMLHAFDFFRYQPGTALPVRPVTAAPATRSAGDLLLDMQRERRHLAVVIDEFGGTQGIVTLEDLIEELVGEIFDEHDEPAAAPVGTAAPLVLETEGAEPLEAVADRFGVKLPAGQSTTLAGLVAELAGRIPHAGERFRLDGLEIDVLAASPARVERLLVRAAPVATLPLGAEP
ncbi:MAG TPA: hemolysin family protein [Gemmatimonadales bacterium]|nr:hemolysin family protein [Gemmatimonadales bacterium]